MSDVIQFSFNNTDLSIMKAKLRFCLDFERNPLNIVVKLRHAVVRQVYFSKTRNELRHAVVRHVVY